jgi:hypothetical protein
MARNSRRVKGGRKQLSEKDFRIFCRKQVLNGLTIDPSGHWVKGDRSRIGVKHMQAGYKVG